MIQPISYHMRLKRSLPNPTPPHPIEKVCSKPFGKREPYTTLYPRRHYHPRNRGREKLKKIDFCLGERERERVSLLYFSVLLSILCFRLAVCVQTTVLSLLFPPLSICLYPYGSSSSSSQLTEKHQNPFHESYQNESFLFLSLTVHILLGLQIPAKPTNPSPDIHQAKPPRPAWSFNRLGSNNPISSM